MEFFEGFDRHFTFGANIGTPASPVPTGPFRWRHTWQPITLDQWETDVVPRDRFTTVMTWQIESFTDFGGNKDQEFIRYLGLPARTTQPFELAVNGPRALLAEQRHFAHREDEPVEIEVGFAVERELVARGDLHPARVRRAQLRQVPPEPTAHADPNGR